MIHILVLISLCIFSAFASSEANLTHTVFGTSSQYHSKSWDLSGAFDEGNVFIDARNSQGTVVHKNFSVNRVSIGHRFNGLRTTPAIRIGVLSREYDGNKTNIPVMTLRGEENIKDKFYYTYTFGYVPMTEEFQTAYTVKEILRGGFAGVGGSYRWSEKWRSTFYFQHYFFNDKNTRLNHDVGLFYGIAPGDPWIWVGVGAGRLSNSNINLPYWVPLEFYTIGPRLDISFSFFEKWRFSSGLNLNYFNDVKTGEGTGYYMNSKLLYKISPTFDLYSGVESIQSKQFGNTWKSNGVSVGVIGKW